MKTNQSSEFDYRTATYEEITRYFLNKFSEGKNHAELVKIDHKWRRLGQLARHNKL